MRTFCLTILTVLASLMIIPSQCNAKINDSLLKEAKLHTVWQSAVALNANEKVEQMTVLGNYIYILTNNNYLFCMDRNDGRQVFSLSAADTGMPVSQPADYNNTAFFVAANELLAIDLVSGNELYKKKIEFPASLKPAVNSNYFYIAGMDKQLHVTDHNMFTIFRVNPDDRSDITSVVANETSIAFGTAGGKVYCMDANQPVKCWEYKTDGAIEAAVVKKDNAIYISGKDTNLYKLDAKTGKRIWKFYTGCFLGVSARVTDNAVYQNAPNKGLYAIDPNSGKQMWLSREDADLLAEDAATNTAYVISKKNVCEVMDNKNAKRLYTINFEAVSAFATNPNDSKMYVMEDNNIFCIEPIAK
ncbi:MAG: PQQ-binding-like beta-propeller repeat protein [Phycisphaerales bacterium]